MSQPNEPTGTPPESQNQGPPNDPYATPYYGQPPSGQPPSPNQGGEFYPGQPAPYPGQPVPYPSQPAPYPGQPAPYPSQSVPYSGPGGDVAPGQQAPYYPPSGPLAPQYMGPNATWPGTGPAQQGQDPYGNVATLAPPAQRTSVLAQRLPLVALLTLGAVVILAMVGAQLTGKDWAAGTLRAGIVTGIVALLIGLATGARSIAGMASRENPFRRAQYTGAAVIAAVLLVISGLSYGLQAPIHRVQAHSLETSQQWSAALDEYGLAGEAAPVSEDLARVQNEWGESQNKAQKFDSAIATFSIVLLSYTSAKLGVRRAQAGITTAYFNAGLLATANKQYVQAMQSYDALLNLPFCEKTCQAETNRLDATTYYHVAEVALAAQDYSTATTAFNTITTRFASAPEASMIHVDYAKALLGLGRKLVASSSCSDALGTYQAITKNFADTASGKQAAIDLLAPQAVKGQFTTTPATGVIVYVDLITNLKIDAQGSILSADNVAYAQVKSDGSFTFDAVPLGTYPLEWFTYDSAGNAKTGSYYVFKGTSNPYYVANVQPLCPFDFGQIASPIVGPPLAKVTGAPMTLTAAPFSAHRLPFALQPGVLTTMRNVSFALPISR